MNLFPQTLSNRFYITLFVVMLFSLSISINAQTETRYYKDETLSRETTEKRAKYKCIIVHEEGVKTITVKDENEKICFIESYKGKEPVGKWTLQLGEELDYTFPLVYQSQINTALELKKDSTKNELSQQVKPIQQMAAFAGGDEGMLRFISSSLRYPRLAIEDNVYGVVYITYIVEKDGTVSDVHCSKKVHPLLDKEAMRVVRKLKYTSPAYQDGQPVRISYSLPVRFVLK